MRIVMWHEARQVPSWLIFDVRQEMLIRRHILEGIASGKVRCAFRRWERPTVKTGGSLNTAIGQLRIDHVAPVSLSSLSAQDARLAGYETKDGLLADLSKRESGTLYRIDLHLEGPDPRVALRGKTDLSVFEIEALRAKLARLDTLSSHGPWTDRVMKLIRTNPKEKAGSLALRLGVPKEWLKTCIRKLKNLGLTISHEPGYELSPRGAQLLARFSRSKSPNKAPEPTTMAVTPRATS